MKKTLAIVLAIVMSASLAACGGAPPAAPADDTPNVEAAPIAEAPQAEVVEEGGTITVWCWDPAFNLYSMEEAAKVYKQINPNFEIDIVETPWDMIQTRITTAATANQLDTLPDIFLCQDNAFQKNVINYPEVFTDLTDSGINFNDFAPAKVEYSVINGRNFGVPFDNGTVINCLRTDVLEEAGYTIADFTDITWDTFIEQGKDILTKTGKPLSSTIAREPDLLMIMLQSTGASLFNTDGSVNIVNNDELKAVLTTLMELTTSGVNIEVNNWDEYITSFVNGSVAGTINGCWILGSVQTAQDQSGLWAVTNIPKLNTPGATNYSNNGGSSWAVSSSSQNKDLAIDFLANTFAGSVPFYETILPSAGALATYLPAGNSSVYEQPQEFFKGQKIFSDITAFAGRTPSNITGAYYYEARDAVGVAMNQIIGGADMETALKEAEDTVIFAMN
ncbi:MAG: extracellular solute-binding protein [Oscillospiraceae bacterium]|nr:extracellular solute-binding protein [Oscillospiraceae bacterium]